MVQLLNNKVIHRQGSSEHYVNLNTNKEKLIYCKFNAEFTVNLNFIAFHTNSMKREKT